MIEIFQQGPATVRHREVSVATLPCRESGYVTTTDLNEASEDELGALLEKYRDSFPPARKPNILICGQMGTGKTTTINTLFGEKVGAEGHYSRGTEHDALYEWESHGQFIDVIDLPGLGDTKKRDHEYVEMYRRRIEKADGFILVVRGYRPLNRATIRTANLLISSGVNPEMIVFAYNGLTEIQVPDADRRVELAGLGGPATDEDAAVVEAACATFYKQLCQEVHGGRYAGRIAREQVVPFDAKGGWNLFHVLDMVLAKLPPESLRHWRDAVRQATRDLERKTEARLRKREAEIERRVRELDLQRGKDARATGTGPSSPGVPVIIHTSPADASLSGFSAERERLDGERRLIEAERRHAAELSRLEKAHIVKIEDRLVDAVVHVVKVAASAVRKGWSKVKNFFHW